jgi:hypothetical protein
MNQPPPMLRASDVAERLGVSRQYAARVIKRIPGARIVRFTLEAQREVWEVDERSFNLWRAGYRFTQLTPDTKMGKSA